MSERSTERTRGGDELASRLEEWGEAERARPAALPEAFARRVRAVRRPRVLRRVLEGLALAAAVALVAYVVQRPAPTPRQAQTAHRGPAPLDHGAAETVAHADAQPTAAGLARRAIQSGTTDWLEPSRANTDQAAPARAGDAYCAGCVDDLTRI
jgi:hypothetical protein